jgi:phospholipid transport system substrate-binding protein
MNILKQCFFVGTFFFMSYSLLFAQACQKGYPPKSNQQPIAEIYNGVGNAQNTLNSSSQYYKTHQNEIVALIKKDVLPIIAVDIIAQVAVGKSNWQAASPNVRKQFIDLFTYNLIYTYSTSIISASQSYQIILNPFTDNSWQNKTVIAVTGSIVNCQKNDTNSSLIIYMLKQKNQWKIYDISVGGVSMLDNFKQQFKSFNSLQSLNNALKNTNAKLSNSR